MMNGLCAVIINKYKDLRIQGLAPLPEKSGSGQGLFSWAYKEALFACLSAIACSDLGPL